MHPKVFLITTNGDTAPPANDQKGMIGVEGRATNVGLQIRGTWTGTITFEASIDKTNWVSVAASPSGGGADVTSTTGNGAWRINARGYSAVRARATAAMTGSAELIFDPQME